MDNARKLLEIAEKLTNKTKSEGKGNPVFSDLDYSKATFTHQKINLRKPKKRTIRNKKDEGQEKTTRNLQSLTRSIQDVLKPLESIKMATTIAAGAALSLIALAAGLKGVQNYEETGNVFGDRSGMSSGQISDKGLQLIKNKEGFRDHAYQDSKGVWTIGYGHTGNVKPGDTITKEAAEELLRKDVARFENTVNKCVKVPISQNQFDALVSLCYNIGPGAFQNSTLVKKLNAGDYEGAAKEFMQWDKIVYKDKSGKKVTQSLAGLTKRREEEAALFRSDIGADGKLNAEPIATYHSETGGNPAYDKKTNTMGGHKVTSFFGHRDTGLEGASKYHKGIDLDHKMGDPVYAFTGGKVSIAGWIQGYGNCVVVIDKNKYGHLYAHLSQIKVDKNKTVKRGDLLGFAGNTTGTVKNMQAHLHYGIFKPGRGITTNANDWIDPLTYLYPEDEEKIKKQQKTPSTNEVKTSNTSNQVKNQQQKTVTANQNKGTTPKQQVKEPQKKPVGPKPSEKLPMRNVQKTTHPTN